MKVISISEPTQKGKKWNLDLIWDNGYVQTYKFSDREKAESFMYELLEAATK